MVETPHTPNALSLHQEHRYDTLYFLLPFSSAQLGSALRLQAACKWLVILGIPRNARSTSKHRSTMPFQSSFPFPELPCRMQSKNQVPVAHPLYLHLC